METTSGKILSYTKRNPPLLDLHPTVERGGQGSHQN